MKADNAKAFEYFQIAAEAGHAEAQRMLGHMYRFGYGVNYGTRDLQKARYWLQQSANQGNQLARKELNELNVNGR